MSVTHANLSLHLKDTALSAFSAGFELRGDERKIIDDWFPKPPACVLDLGVGNGRTTVALAQLGYDVIGIEYCAELLEHGRALHPTIDLRQGDARALAFEAASFDVVMFSWNGIDYMHPLAERTKVLNEMLRCVKPGGLVLLSSHNVGGLIKRVFSPPLLTVSACKFAWDQLVHWQQREGWYCIWRDDALGRPLFYSAPPGVQVKALQDAGLEILEVPAALPPHRPASWWRDVHINYVCRRPLM